MYVRVRSIILTAWVFKANLSSGEVIAFVRGVFQAHKNAVVWGLFSGQASKLKTCFEFVKAVRCPLRPDGFSCRGSTRSVLSKD